MGTGVLSSFTLSVTWLGTGGRLAHAPVTETVKMTERLHTRPYMHACKAWGITQTSLIHAPNRIF